jgi:phage baseplate assembly protein W
MGKITITGLPQVTDPSKNFIHKDIHLDLQVKYIVNNNFNQTPEIRDFLSDFDLNAIKNSLRNLFLTSPGQKILNPTFGLDLRQFLFEQITVSNAREIERVIYGEIAVYEPRVEVREVKVIDKPDSQEYDITISLAVPSLNINNIQLKGTLNSAGFNFN